jgi:polar amino acid transport system permease protein
MMLAAIVQATQKLGLNFGFLTDPHQMAGLLQGALTTIELTLLSGVLSLFVAMGLSVMLRAPLAWLRFPARAFIEITRNTPTLVQLYCAFLVLNILITDALKGARNPFDAFAWVVIVIGFHTGALHAEALRAGFESVPAPMIESARSLALGRRDRLFRIELPIALRFALPALVVNLIEMAKLTVIASAIAVGEITYQAILIWTQSDNVLELMCVILLFFWLLTFVIGRAGRWLERRLRMPGYGR